MLKTQKDISSPKKGMNRATSAHQLGEQEYSFMLNGNMYDESGNRLNVSLEHSNILASKFKPEYKVVGFKYDVIVNKTYFFLTNPITKVSEFGVVENNIQIPKYEDQNKNCTDCDSINVEALPLELQTQIAHQDYQTLLEDSCNLCLNLSVDRPIFDIEIKRENLTVSLYFTETTKGQTPNPPRYIDLNNIEDYKVTGDDNCGEIPTPTCLDCDKLRLQKLYVNPKLESYERVLGGSLKKGTYEAFFAYSDEFGTALSDYVSILPLTPIFDESNRIHDQADNDAETNFAIRFKIKGQDTNFDNYKIVVRYYSNQDTFIDYEEKVHNIADTNILISKNQGKAVSPGAISLKIPKVESADGLTASNNFLFLNGIRQPEPWNLQPVVNFMSLGLKWMSYRAKEDLYSNATSYQYASFNRDENTALAISFQTNKGIETNTFPFVARPPKSSEIVQVDPLNNDILSLTKLAKNCDGIIRDKRWQYYNTSGQAEPINNQCSAELETVTQSETLISYTIVAVPSVPSGQITIEENNISVDFSLKSYLEENLSDCNNVNSAIAQSNICPYVDINNLTAFNETPDEQVDCQPYTTPEEETIIINEIINEQTQTTNKLLEDYGRVRPPESCNVYSDEIDEDFCSQYALRYDITEPSLEGTLKKRLNTIFADSPTVAYPLPFITKDTVRQAFAPSLVHPYFGANLANTTGTREQIFANHITNKNALPSTVVDFDRTQIGGLSNTQATIVGTSGVYTSKIHKGAIWLEIDITSRKPLLIEVSKLTDSSNATYRQGKEVTRYNNRNVRIHFFASTSDVDPIAQTSYEDENGNPTTQLGGIYELNSTPSLISINQAAIDQSTSNTMYMVVDLPLSEADGLGEDNYLDDEPLGGKIPTGITIPLDSCFSVNAREVEISKVETTYDSITLSKRQKYQTECEYTIDVLSDCAPVPYLKGELGYYESTDTYPDNDQMYNSIGLSIEPEDITNIEVKNKYEEFYAQSQTNYNPNQNADFRCKPIRHFKLPDNKLSPFINTNRVANTSDSIISPLGFVIEDNTVNDFLNIAVKNELITQEQKDSIVSYKIYRADTSLDRSIVASGLLYQTKTYKDQNNKDIRYLNFPYNSLGENKYSRDTHDSEDNQITYASIHSPELDYYKTQLPSELSLQGFVYGGSQNNFDEQTRHSKMVILGDKARTLATVLAIAEVVSELLITQYRGSEAYRVEITAIGGSANPVGVGLGIAVAAIGILGSVFKVGKYRYEWLNTFENLGTPYNFGYTHMSTGNYNYFKTDIEEGNSLRGISLGKYIKSGFLNLSDTNTGAEIQLNNYQREESAFISLGKDNPLSLVNNVSYLNYDNSSTAPTFSSQPLSSEIGCEVGLHSEFSRNIASPYVALKNYIPNQYGTIDSINWIDTGACFKLTESTECKGILGGDTFITRHSVVRKAPLFQTTLFGQPDLTALEYDFYSNYGKAKYYINYKVSGEANVASSLFPNIEYKVRTDCGDSDNNFYLKPPSKFYLQSRGTASFLTETRINTSFRNARREPQDQFYPQNTDYTQLQQEDIVSIKEEENFYYNKVYNNTQRFSNTFSLPFYYDKENYKKTTYNPNFVMYSRQDSNENSLVDPWTIFRPNDVYTFPTAYGNLTRLKGIESNQVLGYFENQTVVFNAVDTFVDGVTVANQDFGTGGIFARRPRTFYETDLGYMGTQTHAVLSNEYGHFSVDTKRGQVFLTKPNAQGAEEISKYSGGKPNNMDIWFKEQLPFKITRTVPGINTDNPYNGVGIHWGWDSKFKRVLLTKRDYIYTGPETCIKEGLPYDLAPVQATIDQKEQEGFEYIGIEGCQMKFEKSSITTTTDIYAIFDTTSMQPTDGVSAAAALQTWYSNYQTLNPQFEGQLYILPFGVENYVNYPKLITLGTQSTTSSGTWSSIEILPPNYNTPEWVPPTDLLLLAFVDETNSQYHGSQVSQGFTGQPSTTYFQDFINFKNEIANNYSFFKGVVYPIVQNVTNTGGALVLQALAAIKGRILTQAEIDQTNTTVDVSILLTENPYVNAPIPNTNPQEFLEPLEDYGWVGQYDKVSPASEVFTSEQFQEELNTLINSGSQSTEVVFEDLNRVEIGDPQYFKDISWTISYRPETGSWESYMSYTPNYYINHTDYFQSGINNPKNNPNELGLWSHLLSNKSYRVFYGLKYPHIIELPIKNQYISRELQDVSLWTSAKRYHNEYDFSVIDRETYSNVTIFNNQENSGRLNLIQSNGTFSQKSKYPITNNNLSQDILITSDNQESKFNYFYNRVKSNRNNQPIWLWDDNQIQKELNSQAISFYGKKTLERMHNTDYMVRLEYNGSTNYDLELKWVDQETKQKI